MIGSAFVPDSAQLWIWGGLIGVTIVTWLIMGRIVALWSDEPIIVSESLVERFGLITIIVLGEVVVGVVHGIAESERNVETIATGMLALAVGFGLWWNYFDMTGRRLPREDQTGMPFWSLLHIPLTMSIAAAGAAMVTIIEHAGDNHSPEVATWILAGGAAITLITIAVMVRTLEDYERLRSIFLPTSIAMVIVAIGSIPLSLWKPEPIVLVSVLFAALSAVWFFAAWRWLASEDDSVVEVDR